MEMQEVFDAIATEREYQDRKCGNIFTNPHDIPRWLLILEIYLRKAKDAYMVVNGPRGKSPNYGDFGAMVGIRKLIAIGVACAEQHGFPARNNANPGNPKSFKLTQRELALCPTHPGVLRELANHHSIFETEAAACDMPESAEFHKQRAAELRAEANRIQAEWGA